ncbi:hypothetical protein Q3G72_031762 [Acer saccharum]|nr:hypothetical protein Q3G72_031762 [Acer saccharum]
MKPSKCISFNASHSEWEEHLGLIFEAIILLTKNHFWSSIPTCHDIIYERLARIDLLSRAHDQRLDLFQVQTLLPAGMEFLLQHLDSNNFTGILIDSFPDSAERT